ncbi:DUF3883 domain-containing protein [Sabulibacter ruber]|uniref:DUF3883 domain-containing protein n=1 Tax=Sabulibacter ruber TaxID=2811901 RepID=UPI001A9570CA|nr:DUF3883 domain-containing protein [Sabulibacter ruber]
MFSVSVIYSTRDFLNFLLESHITPERFEQTFKKYRYSNPEKILQVAFKCNWISLDGVGTLSLSKRGNEIAVLEYRDAILLQLEDMILNFNPTWASLLPKGREEAKQFLPEDVFQCFKEAGLFGVLNDNLIKYWDRISIAYRSYSNQKMLEIGRKGERLSLEYERQRTNAAPLWQSLESNLSGFDILSVVDRSCSDKLSIEVKSTTSKLEYATFYISKNEWETAENTKNYLFHLWVLEPTPNLFIISKDAMSQHIPQNNGNGTWQSVNISFKAVLSNPILVGNEVQNHEVLC